MRLAAMAAHSGADQSVSGHVDESLTDTTLPEADFAHLHILDCFHAEHCKDLCVRLGVCFFRVLRLIWFCQHQAARDNVQALSTH
jgi:hypothetical protein